MSSCLSKFRSYMGPYHIHRINDGGIRAKGNGEIRDAQDTKWGKWFTIDCSEDVDIDYYGADNCIVQVSANCRRNPMVVLSHVDSVTCSSENYPTDTASPPRGSGANLDHVFSECRCILDDIVTQVEKLQCNTESAIHARSISSKPQDDQSTDDVFLDCYQAVQEIADKVSVGSELSVRGLCSSMKYIRFVDRTAGRPTAFYTDLWQKLCSGTWPENNVAIILPTKRGTQAPTNPDTQLQPSCNVSGGKRKSQALLYKPLRKTHGSAVREAALTTRRTRSSSIVNSTATIRRKRTFNKKHFYDYQYVYSDNEVLMDDFVWNKTPPKLRTRSTNPTVDLKKLTFQLKYPPCVVLEVLRVDVLRVHLASDL